jgi:ribosome-dependent ATPase
MLGLILIPAMMTALGVVREKELGSISNLYTSPASTTQFLIGKQIPYILTALGSYFSLVWIAIVIIGVPIKGSFMGLTIGAFLLVCTATGFGLWISSMMKTQVSAVFATAVAAMIPALNFSGFLYPLSSITGSSHWVGQAFPAAYFQQISLGAFTKGLDIDSFVHNYVIILGFGVAYVTLASLCLQKQEK